MNKGPNIVANRWHEVASSLEKTGFFQEDQLNLEDVLRILPDLVRRYTAVLGYVAEGELTPIGSGTFLRRKDGQCGILTAGHVVGAIKNKESIRVLPTQDREEVDWIGIEGMGMHGWGETNTGLKGPDIGWMPLSAKEAASIESLGGVFHNRRRTMEDFSGEVCQISVAFGFVDAASSPSDKKIVAHPMFIGRRRRGRIPLYPTISRHISDPFFCSRAPGWPRAGQLLSVSRASMARCLTPHTPDFFGIASHVNEPGLVVDDCLAAVSVAAHRCRLPSIRHLVRLGVKSEMPGRRRAGDCSAARRR